MKICKFILFVICAAVSVGAVAQDVRGVVRGAGDEPLAGASVYWAGTTVGASADADGVYSVHRVKGYDRLVAAYVGYVNDTVRVAAGTLAVDFRLSDEGIEIESVVVEGSQSGNYVKRDGILKSEMISFAGLCKMACCNLAESFENSASVTVGYSDAISGARQIKMLGLAGTYTQILDENRPIMRGLSAPYGLSYTPGMWLNSIQVSKGISSVTAGHEAITGQINLEHRKPTDDERLFVNLYLDSELRPEANISTALPVTRDKKLSTVVLLHGSMDTRSEDENRDGFRDLPEARQVNVANRWLYAADNGAQLRWGWKYLREDRQGGMKDYRRWMRGDMAERGIYGSTLDNEYANGYIKFGMPVGEAVYDAEEQEELRSNVAFVADYSYYSLGSYFGLNDYDARENDASLNAMYSHYFSNRSSLIVGLSAQWRKVGQTLANRFWDESSQTVAPYPLAGELGRSPFYDYLRHEEIEAGAYAEYTYTVRDKFSLVVGLRGDYNSWLDRFFLTPRGHVKWNITSSTVLRASAGMGYRTADPLTDNIGVLATGRRITPAGCLSGPTGAGMLMPCGLDLQEKALTFGGSLTQTFGLVNPEDATLSFDFFRTQFYNQVIVDQEFGPSGGIYDAVVYSNDGRSYTNSYQVDFSWTPLERFDIFATFRYTDSAVTLDREGEGGAVERVEVERPLISRYKALLNLQYATRFRRWTFDFTAQLNGPCRLPSFDGDLQNERLSPVYPIFFAQVSHKVGKFDIYVGCENIGDYMQHDPITVDGHKFRPGVDSPFDASFNSSAVWGPLMGRKFYIGLRFNLY